MNDLFAHKAKDMDAPTRVQMVRNFLDELRGWGILGNISELIDLGAGTGLVSLSLSATVGHITAVDSSPAMLAILEQKMHEQSVSNIDTIQGTLADYQDKPVEVIIALMVAHHIEDIHSLFIQACEKLKPGGLFIIGDLVTEDGSFHGHESVPHHGFDLAELSHTAYESGFQRVESNVYDTMAKDGRNYPLFVLIAKKEQKRTD